jgi:hypothetical protein
MKTHLIQVPDVTGKEPPRYLDTYGETKQEMELNLKPEMALAMSFDSALTRLPFVQKFYPHASIISIDGAMALYRRLRRKGQV